MSTREAIKLLEDVGYKMKRMGRGSHMIFQKDNSRIVISAGQQELSPGMTAKVRTFSRK